MDFACPRILRQITNINTNSQKRSLFYDTNCCSCIGLFNNFTNHRRRTKRLQNVTWLRICPFSTPKGNAKNNNPLRLLLVSDYVDSRDLGLTNEGFRYELDEAATPSGNKRIMSSKVDLTGHDATRRARVCVLGQCAFGAGIGCSLSRAF
jgi:hypothetical protein